MWYPFYLYGYWRSVTIRCRLRSGLPFYVTASWSERKGRFSGPSENLGTLNSPLYFVWFGIGNRNGFCGTTGMRFGRREHRSEDRPTFLRVYKHVRGIIHRTVNVKNCKTLVGAKRARDIIGTDTRQRCAFGRWKRRPRPVVTISRPGRVTTQFSRHTKKNYTHTNG